MAQDAPTPIDPTAAPADSQQRVQLRVDQREMETLYANTFQLNGTPEEAFVTFGVNAGAHRQANAEDPQVVLKLESRVIMNWYSAKRLAIQLTQAVRQHEAQFGELELDASKRLINK